MTFDSGSKILITGGTGSFGKAFISCILKQYPEIERLVIYSRDELKQWELQQLFPKKSFPNLRFFLGDIRDRDRLRRALEGIDSVVHAAALKQVPAAEYNPIEFINTKKCKNGINSVAKIMFRGRKSPISILLFFIAEDRTIIVALRIFFFE